MNDIFKQVYYYYLDVRHYCENTISYETFQKSTKIINEFDIRINKVRIRETL